mgnify:FL=1
MKRIAITHERYLLPDLASGVVVVRGSSERLCLEGKLVSRVRQTIADGPAVRQKKGLTRSNESVPEILSRLRSGKFINTLNGTNVQLLTTTWRYQLWTRENTNGCGSRGITLASCRPLSVYTNTEGCRSTRSNTAGTFPWCVFAGHRSGEHSSSCASWPISYIVRFCRKAECLLPLKVGGIPPFGTLTRLAAASQSGL